MLTGKFWQLEGLGDDALTAGTLRLVRADRRVSARLLAHLSETDERRLHLKQASSSMFEYCLHLGMSEDEAGRRLCAAGVAKRFPVVYDLIDQGKLSLSVVCKLKQYLTADNHLEVLSGVSGLSYRKAEAWLAARFARPDVPSTVRKLPENHTRERGRVEPLSAERYRVQLTADRALKEKLELAAELMAHRSRSRDIAQVVTRALDVLNEKLEKERFAATSRPRRSKAAKPGRVTNATKREVIERDGLRCSFGDEHGKRCNARGELEFDHRHPRGKGGGSEPSNVRVLCRAHNQYEAERAYGRAHVERAKRQRSKRREVGPQNRA